jgi:hypothetical protein
VEFHLLRRLVVVEPQRAALLRDAYTLRRSVVRCPRAAGKCVEVRAFDGELGVPGSIGVLIDALVASLFISGGYLAFDAVLG